MARAKRTDRAEARRKYRAYLQAQEEAELAAAPDSDETTAEAATKPGRSRPGSPAPVVQPGARMGIFAAAKGAYRSANYIDDIRNIRSLTFGSKAVWAPLLLCVASGVYLDLRLTSGGSGDPILPFVWQFVFYPVPLAPPILAGFLAPRATWLAGLIAGFFATITLVVALLLSSSQLSATANAITPTASSSPSGSAAASASAAGSPSVGSSVLVTASPAAESLAASSSASAVVASSGSPAPSPSASGGTTSSTDGKSTGDVLAVTISLLSTSLAFGALMGALTGWYKRFLTLTSGSTKRPTPRSGGGRPAQRRPAARGARR